MNIGSKTGAGNHTNGCFRVAMKDLDKTLRHFQKLEDGGETAIKRTVSDFVSRAPAWISKAVRQNYNVNAAGIKAAGPHVEQGAGADVGGGGLAVAGAALVYKGSPLTTTHFNQSPKAAPTGRQSRSIRVPGQAVNTAEGSPVATINPPKKYTVKATIIKGSRVSLGSNVFIASGNGGSTLPFQKKSDARMPIEAVKTLSVPQMISGRAKEDVEKIIDEKLTQRFEHHVQQAMK